MPCCHPIPTVTLAPLTNTLSARASSGSVGTGLPFRGADIPRVVSEIVQ